MELIYHYRYEATIMVVMYIVYIIIMYFNSRLAEFFTPKLDACFRQKSGKPEISSLMATEREESQPLLNGNVTETNIGQEKRYGITDTQIGNIYLNPQGSVISTKILYRTMAN